MILWLFGNRSKIHHICDSIHTIKDHSYHNEPALYSIVELCRSQYVVCLRRADLGATYIQQTTTFESSLELCIMNIIGGYYTFRYQYSTVCQLKVCHINATIPATNVLLMERALVPSPLEFTVSLAAPFSTPVAVALFPDLVADGVEADAEADAEEAFLGHGFSYTNCSGAPLHLVAFVASKVPLGYLQQVPEAYGELLGLCGLKTA